MRMTGGGWHAVVAAVALAAVSALVGCGRAPAARSIRGETEPRIISLAPSVTEMLFAIGAGSNLVGRTDVCNWPPEAAAVPVVGSFGRPSIEAILRQRPTLVLTVDLEDERILDPLARAGIAHRRIACETLDDIPVAIRAVGSLAGAHAAAAVLADRLAAELSRLRAGDLAAAPDEFRPQAFAEIWGDPLMTAGRRSFVAELVRLAGCDNLGDAVDGAYFTVSPEWVIIRDPEIIFCLYMTTETQAVQRVAGRVGWQAVRAVRRGTVYDGFDTDLLFRPGPRVIEGIAALRACVELSREVLP
jgi:iron complex transport system substrate-binding protein